ncbi:Ribulokinase [Alkalibacterium sp. AK22]|nr:Ribulokinase [Alkalibacterium sp. AK22]
MMHGYLAFDSQGQLLTPFRTWRNTTTQKASKELTELFAFNIPQRWSIAHLHQAILDKEEHVKEIAYLTTLAGYIHWKLTGVKAVGVGEASGMFPVDSLTGQFDQNKIDAYDQAIQHVDKGWTLLDILPDILSAGESAGSLTKEGAILIDPSGTLKPGVRFCPPEGDAGTGMVATNAVAEQTGNVSAGTSVFAMLVLKNSLLDYYEEIDMVTTPAGKPTAMVHCNNFTTDINAWAGLFKDLFESFGFEVSDSQLFHTLFNKALEAEPDNGQLMSCNYYSGEPITGLEEGRPLFVQMPDSTLSLANFMRTQIYSALATLKLGMDTLILEEGVSIKQIVGHGGFFKTAHVGQQMMADALNASISVTQSAGEGGPWGMALLASYLINKEAEENLEDFLSDKVFSQQQSHAIKPQKEGQAAFKDFLLRYKELLKVEKSAVSHMQ